MSSNVQFTASIGER